MFGYNSISCLFMQETSDHLINLVRSLILRTVTSFTTSAPLLKISMITWAGVCFRVYSYRQVANLIHYKAAAGSLCSVLPDDTTSPHTEALHLQLHTLPRPAAAVFKQWILQPLQARWPGATHDSHFVFILPVHPHSWWSHHRPGTTHRPTHSFTGFLCS